MRKIFIMVIMVFAILPVVADETEDTQHIDMENGVLGIADNRGFTL